MRFPLVYEATTSRAEFARLLPVATGEPTPKETADGYAGGGWRVRLTPLPVLAIGSVRMERYRVELSFDGLTDEQQADFMARFSRHYQRGGG